MSAPFTTAAQLGGEPVFLVLTGADSLSAEEVFLVSVLAQLSGTVIARLELIAAERVNSQLVATLNAELESTVATLAKIMEVHRRLNEIVASAGETGIAEALSATCGCSPTRYAAWLREVRYSTQTWSRGWWAASGRPAHWTA
jgi:hypothetical protein